MTFSRPPSGIVPSMNSLVPESFIIASPTPESLTASTENTAAPTSLLTSSRPQPSSLPLIDTTLVPAAYQRLVVQANELSFETPQIAHHIAATRRAWGIADVQSRELGPATELTPATIAANRATIDNVRLWDREPLLQTFGQLQSIRTYYNFVSVDDDRYPIGGQVRQVMLSAREMDTDALPTKGFINEHLTYTHGMGLTLGPSNEVTAEGLPVLFIKVD